MALRQQYTSNTTIQVIILGSNKWVVLWTGVVMVMWKIAICRWIVQRSNLGHAIAYKSPSKWPPDPPDGQSGSTHMIVSNH